MRIRDAIPAPQDPNWSDHAACIGTPPGVFYATEDGSHGAGRDVCAACTVREDCLSHAFLAPENFGTWGMVTEKERERLRRRLRRGAVTWEGVHRALDAEAAAMLDPEPSGCNRRR